VRPVSTAVLNGGFDLSRVDVLIVSSGLRYDQLTPAARASVDALLARGGVVTRGATGSRFNADAALLSVTAVPGRGDANGIVEVDNADASVLVGALPQSFVYSPQWFTGLGDGVRAEQRYGTFIAGHWLPNEDGSGGPELANGQAAVVSGVSGRGARVLMFGTEPMFRAHPKGLYAQVAAAIYWGAAG
jgi:hypothetical protein